MCTRSTFHETINANEVLLQTAERRIEFLESKGIYAQSRSFRDIVDVNRSALQRLQATRQFYCSFHGMKFNFAPKAENAHQANKLKYEQEKMPN